MPRISQAEFAIREPFDMMAEDEREAFVDFLIDNPGHLAPLRDVLLSTPATRARFRAEQVAKWPHLATK